MLNANKWNICFLIIFRSSMAFNGVSLRISSASGRFWTLFVIWIPMFNLHYSNGCLCVRAHVFVYVFAFFARVYSLQNIFNSTIVCRFVYCYWQLQHSSFKYREFRLLKRFLLLVLFHVIIEVFWNGHHIFFSYQTKLTLDVHTFMPWHAINLMSKQ